jgi:ArsR family transcriptional regulator, arsenate/arsenite/antimonite-responsive transcriptional repressor
VQKQELKPTGQNAGRVSGEVTTEDEEVRISRLVTLGQALSDPKRVKMLGMIAGGRGCCDLPDLGVPVGEKDTGICVCEFEDYFGMGQSKVSYHIRKLKDAGLVKEEKRGKWSFYSLDREAADVLLGEAVTHLLVAPTMRKIKQAGDGCC